MRALRAGMDFLYSILSIISGQIGFINFGGVGIREREASIGPCIVYACPLPLNSNKIK